MKPALLILLLCSAPFMAFPQWFQHSSIPIDKELYRVTFTDASHGWIIGSDGTILFTADGGITWAQQASHTDKHMYGISMVDNLHGWVVGNIGVVPYGIVLRTRDGGSNWETLDTPGFWISDVCFTDTLHGWITGANTTTGGPGIVKITQDGGNSWTEILLPGLMFPKEVVFFDSQTGFIGGDHREGDRFRLKVLKTTDGGLTWSTFVDWGVDGDMFFFDMMFHDALTGWISGSYYAVEIGAGTNDNGFIARIENGSTSYSDFIYEEWWKPRAICFTSNHSGWAVGQDGLFMDTRDNGTNWTTQYLPPGVMMNDIFFTDEQHGWAVGYGGTVMYTENNGYSGTDDFTGTGHEDPEIKIFPNPTNYEVNLEFEMQSAGQVTIHLYNITGQSVEEIFKGFLPKGIQTIDHSLADIPDGVYFIRIADEKEVIAKKLLILKNQ